MTIKSYSLTFLICAMALPVGAADKRFIAFGDSNTFGHGDNGVRCFETGPGGYPPRLRSKLLSTGLDVEMLNLGLCNERTAQGVTRLQNLELDADVIIIMEGTNDFSGNIGVETVLFNLDRMADTAEAAGVVPLMASVVPRGPDENGVQNNFATEDLADLLKQASADAGRVFADPFHALFIRPNFFDDFYFNELHPNAVGFDIVATTFVEPALAAAATNLPGRLEFTGPVFAAAESSGSATITVARSGGAQGLIDVAYNSSNGSAAAGIDYLDSSGTLSWGDGDSGIKSFDVTIVDDAVEEFDETVNLTLSNPTGGATLGSPSSASLTISDDDAPPPGVCIADQDTLCLNEGGRFRVEVTWRTTMNETGRGQAVDIGREDSGLFYFFSPNNLEMLVKVLNGCDIPGFGTYWVFFAATTDVGFTLTVIDTENEVTKIYTNPLGQPANAITDTQAFATCP